MESTVIRRVDTTAMLVGPGGAVADKVTSAFELGRMRVVRAGHAAAACERLAIAMPQIVVVFGTLRPDEREALADRATAIGALVLYVDPEVDDETLQDLIARAGQAALERKIARDDAAPSSPDVGDAGDDELEIDIDADW